MRRTFAWAVAALLVLLAALAFAEPASLNAVPLGEDDEARSNPDISQPLTCAFNILYI